MGSIKRPRVVLREDISAEQLRREAMTSRPSKAKKLLALARLVDGEHPRTIAYDSEVSIGTIYYWIHCLNANGIHAFERRARRTVSGLADHKGVTAAGLRAAAARSADSKASKRLLAIAKLLGKERPSRVAADLGVSPSTISCWAERFNESGIDGLVTRRESSSTQRFVIRRDIPYVEVYSAAKLAARRTQWRAARRLTAVALVLDGLKLVTVAERLGVSPSSVSKWCIGFNKDGIEGMLGPWDVHALRKRQSSIRKSLAVSDKRPNP